MYIVHPALFHHILALGKYNLSNCQVHML